MALDMWKFTEQLMVIQRPNGRASLVQSFFRSKVNSFESAMRISLICCTLWEIWKCRNCLTYGDTKLSSKGVMLRWYRDLFGLITLKFIPPNPPARWSQFEAVGSGCLVSVALIRRQGRSFGAAIFKPWNSCKWSLVCSPVCKGDGFGELISFLSKVIGVGRNHGFEITKICSSNAFMCWLDPKENEVPWNELCSVRCFRAKFQGISFVKCCPISNNGALAAAEALAQGSSQVLQVPWVLRALSNDRQRLSFFCRSSCCSHQEVFSALPASSCDDTLLGRRPHREPD